MAPKGMKTRRWLVTVIKVTVSGVLIYALLDRIGLDTLTDQFRSLIWGWLAVSLLVFSLSNVLGSFQWYLLLRSSGINLPFTRVLSYYHVGLFFNNFLIGYVGGDAFRIYDIHKSSGDSTGAVSTVFFDRFLGFFAMTTLAMLVSVLGITRLASSSAVYAIALILAFWLVALVVLFDERIARLFAMLFRRIIPDWVHVKLRSIYYGIHQFRHNKNLLVGLLLVSFTVQALRVITHYAAARALHVDIGLFYFFVFIPIIALVSSLPISLGGIGVREQSGVALFAQIGLSSARVTAFELLAYLVGILASLPGGLLFAFRREHHITPPVTQGEGSQ